MDNRPVGGPGGSQQPYGVQGETAIGGNNNVQASLDGIGNKFSTGVGKPNTGDIDENKIKTLTDKSKGTLLSDIGKSFLLAKGFCKQAGSLVMGGALYGVSMVIGGGSTALSLLAMGLGGGLGAAAGGVIGGTIGALSGLLPGRSVLENAKAGASGGAKVGVGIGMTPGALLDSLALLPKALIHNTVGKLGTALTAFGLTGEEDSTKKYELKRSLYYNTFAFVDFSFRTPQEQEAKIQNLLKKIGIEIE